MSDTKLRVITDTPAPKPAESENPISQTIPWTNSVTDFLKDDSPLMQVIEKIPFLAPLKDMIVWLKKFSEKIGIQLGDLKNEVEQNVQNISNGSVDIGTSNENTNTPPKNQAEGRGGVRGQEISNNQARNWIEESKLDTKYKTATDFFVKKWLTLAQSVGIVANLHHESTLNPRAVGDGGKAIGIAQWHPDRRQAILKGCGIDISKASLEQQLEALWWEITKWNEKATYNAIIKCKTEEEAAKQFCLLFERPANKHVQAAKRATAANDMMAKIENWQNLA